MRRYLAEITTIVICIYSDIFLLHQALKSLSLFRWLALALRILAVAALFIELSQSLVEDNSHGVSDV